jgi:hypothetical protein
MIWSRPSFRNASDGFAEYYATSFISSGEGLEWRRLIDRFDVHWRLLFGFVVLFGFVYPDQRHRIPSWVIDELTSRFLREQSDEAGRVCNGTLLSREQYLHDVCVRGYQDARIVPPGRMTPDELEIWTAAIRGKYE